MNEQTSSNRPYPVASCLFLSLTGDVFSEKFMTYLCSFDFVDSLSFKTYFAILFPCYWRKFPSQQQWFLSCLINHWYLSSAVQNIFIYHLLYLSMVSLVQFVGSYLYVKRHRKPASSLAILKWTILRNLSCIMMALTKPLSFNWCHLL